jgi:hypothetical protein
MRNASVSSRVAELHAEIQSAFIDLQITEREQRLKAKQWIWDLLRKAILFRAIGDYPRMMATGIVVCRLRAVGTGAKQQVVEEYEIDTAAIEALMSIEREASIECGQRSEKQDITINGKLDHRAAVLADAFTIEELEQMQARMLAAIEKQAQTKAPGVGPAEAPKAIATKDLTGASEPPMKSETR